MHPHPKEIIVTPVQTGVHALPLLDSGFRRNDSLLFTFTPPIRTLRNLLRDLIYCHSERSEESKVFHPLDTADLRAEILDSCLRRNGISASPSFPPPSGNLGLVAGDSGDLWAGVLDSGFRRNDGEKRSLRDNSGVIQRSPFAGMVTSPYPVIPLQASADHP